MSIENIKSFFNSELKLVDDFIIRKLKSNISLINNIGEYVIMYGGKRIRPLLVILFSKAFSCDESKFVAMASSIELIHTATLLHDDVVDFSDKRRGKATVNKLWGNKEAILVGDFLYTRSFQMMIDANNLDVLELMSKTTNIMSEGEVYQLVNRGNFDIEEKDCLEIIKCKTAELFSAATSVGAIISNVNEKYVSACLEYGKYLGMAYQLIDDILDYSTDDVRFGKNIGTDLFNSTFTLPLVHVMNTDLVIKEKIKYILKSDIDHSSILEIRKFVIDSDAINYTFNIASNYIKLAKDAILSIPGFKYTDLAISLADFILSRRY